MTAPLVTLTSAGDERPLTVLGGSTAVLNSNRPGSFDLAVAWDPWAAAALREGAGGRAPRVRVLPTRGAAILTGYVTGRASGETAAGAKVLRLSGIDDTGLAADRVAHPDPLNGAPPYAAVDAFAGRAGEAIGYYLDRNLGDGALPGRREVTVDITAGLGELGSWAAEWQDLDLLLSSIARDGGVVFEAIDRHYVVRVPTLAVELDVSVGLGRPWTHYLTRPDATHGYGLGAGVGGARDVVEAENVTNRSWWGRKERAWSFSGTAGDTALAVELRSRLTFSPASIGATLVEAAGARYAVDYRIGDRVAVTVPDEGTVVAPVSSVVFAWSTPSSTEAGFTVTPHLGDGPTPQVRPQQFRRLARIERTLSDTRAR